MVHIKKLEVYGFKSFGFKNTIVNFEKGLVAVTGPNGSGKSNILDAIMFAIGENSPKLLRVDKFQSLFHDSENSKHRLVRVSLTFDNQDRGIPTDFDTVTLTRQMEGQTGDSQYFLNGKAVSKTAIVELLEVVLAAPNKMNIVQQGMITRISELNSEERRKIIEDIVGLSYFDEKKAESLKQLDESDRRLEIALARMDEIRKRIDELEAERNDQIRYKQIEDELKRFKAVRISNNMRSIRNKIKASTEILDVNTMQSMQLSKQIEDARQEIEKLDLEKTKFIEEVDAANRTKAQVASRIATVVVDYERMKAMLKESEQRVSQISSRMPSADVDKQRIAQKIENLRLQAEKARSIIAEKKSVVSALKSELEVIDCEIDELTGKMARYASFKQKLEGRLGRLISIKNEVDVSIARLGEKIEVNNFKISAIESEISSLRSVIGIGSAVVSDLQSTAGSGKAKLQEIGSALDNMRSIKASLENELAGSSSLLTRAEIMATKFETRASLAKNAMSEDFAIAELMKYSKKFGIRGLVHDLIHWDSEYERPVLAAGSEWMKAFVVDDIKSMLAIATYAKEKKLPRLKIIPLDIVKRYSRASVSKNDVNIVGSLANFVSSNYKKLPDFLFGNTIVAKNPSSAFAISKQGYRSVSIDGELFEPEGESMSIDFGSKISDLTKAILLGNSVENLRESLDRLKKIVEKKTADLKEIVARISASESKQIKLEASLQNFDMRISGETSTIKNAEQKMNGLASGIKILQAEAGLLANDLEKCKRRMSLLVPASARVSRKVQKIDESATRSRLAELNVKRNQLIKAIEGSNMEQNQLTASITNFEDQIEFSSRQVKEMDDEKERLASELSQRSGQISESRDKLQSLESELKALRDKEQQIIDSSGSSYSVLQEYERKIKVLVENERKLSRDNSVVEREADLLRKDVSDLVAQESRLSNDLVWLGYKNLLDELDVDAAIKELTDEFETVKTKINLRADESYIQVIEGYRGMSSRRNQLEAERNSIVSFIEQIVKEKENVFMDAFKKVDGDIRKTFSEMNSGSAWLEIENPEDIFSSGVMLIVQFPGKAGRESTALSGGEKTIAATVFLLALQSLKPSPFYLLDEVDAHLDAQNTEKLSKVLLQRSMNNQIIMVTLKDSTVAKAGLIYGVYPKQGASQVVKYKNQKYEPSIEVQANN